MNGDLYFDGKRYISSSRAAKITGYVNDYIGQLCRDGKLDCRMVGRSWYVSFDSLVEHKNLFSSGRRVRTESVRKRSLTFPKREPISAQSVLISNTFESQNVSASIPKLETGFLLGSGNTTGFDEVLSEQGIRLSRPKNEIEVKIFSGAKPSEIWSYSSGPLVSYVLKEIIREEENREEHREFLTDMLPRAVAGIISVFVALSGFWFALQSNKDAQIAYNGILNSVRDRSNSILTFAGDELQANVFNSGKKFIDTAGLFVYEKTNDILFKTKNKILVLVGDKKISEKVVERSVTISEPSQGLVVVPTDPSTDRQAVVSRIKNSFSDEVTVEPSSDGSNGVITPVFKQSKGDDYLYVLVPIKN